MSKTPSSYSPMGVCVVCLGTRDEYDPHHPECPVGLVESAKLRAIHSKREYCDNGPDYYNAISFPDLDLPGDGWDAETPAHFGQYFGKCIAESSRYSLEPEGVTDPARDLPMEMVFLPPPSVREPVTKAFWEEHNRITGKQEKLKTRQKLEVLIRKTESEHGALADRYERDQPGLNDYGKSLREQELIALADQIVAMRRDLDKLNKELGK